MERSGNPDLAGCQKITTKDIHSDEENDIQTNSKYSPQFGF